MSFHLMTLPNEISTADAGCTTDALPTETPNDGDSTEFFKALTGDQHQGQPADLSRSTPKADPSCQRTGLAPADATQPRSLGTPSETVEQLLDMVTQLIELLQQSGAPCTGDNPTHNPINNTGPIGSLTPDNGAPETNPPASAQPILTNSVIGGSGKPQRDMDDSKAGTQINVVLDRNMNASDREKAFEALRRWEDASNGALDFTVYEAGQQPGGEDYTIMRAVPPDNTNQAGVADVGRSPDGVTELEFESGTALAVVMHEIGHTLGFRHGDGVLKAVNASEKFSEQNLADLANLYPDTSRAIA